MTNWVVVADSRHAKIFAAENAHFDLNEVADFINSQRNERGHNPPGQTFGEQTGTRHGLEPQTLPKEKSMRAFAVELAQYLQREFLQQHFTKLVLVAAPEFLGELRAAFSEMLRASIAGSVAKDLLAYSDAELSSYLRAQPGLH